MVRGVGSMGEAIGDALRGGNDAASEREINQLNESIKRVVQLPHSPENTRLRDELIARQHDLLVNTSRWGDVKALGHVAAAFHGSGCRCHRNGGDRYLGLGSRPVSGSGFASDND